jgi:hypothetical protein
LFRFINFTAAIKVLASKVAKDEAALATLVSRKEVLRGNVEVACRKCEDLVKPEVLLDLIQKNTPEANDIRLRLRAELRKRIAKIGIAFVPDSVRIIGGFIIMSIICVNGVMHMAAFRKGDSTLLLMEDIQDTEDIAQRLKAYLDKLTEERIAFLNLPMSAVLAQSD